MQYGRMIDWFYILDQGVRWSNPYKLVMAQARPLPGPGI